MHRTFDPSDILAQLTVVGRKVAEAETPQASFDAVAAGANHLIGHRLMTILMLDPTTLEVHRLYSTNPQAYPAGGSKPMRATPWGLRVLEEGRHFIGYNADDIRANFADHELIIGLGLESILNVPVRLHGRVLGTMNLLHEADFYQDEHRTTADLLASVVAAPLMEAGRI
jgi:GAF domain-containing protein